MAPPFHEGSLEQSGVLTVQTLTIISFFLPRSFNVKLLLSCKNSFQQCMQAIIVQISL